MSNGVIPIKAGSPIMISGPTGSGKTYFVHKLLKNNMFSEKLSSILYCYGVYQNYFDDILFSLPDITFHEVVPDLELIKSLNNGKFNIIVLDDLMEQIIKNVDSQNLFTKYCHHFNITAIFITQNIFAQGPYSRSINLNTHITILFKNKRDETQIHVLGKQMFPGKKSIFIEAYEDATKEMFGYLLVDCDPSSSDQLKLRTKIFPDEKTICYLKKD